MSTILEQVKSGKELRREREQRIMDAIRLKKTDRVPVSCEIGFFAAKYAGIPCSAAYYDCDAWLAAYRKTLRDFQPDMAFTRAFTPGKALESRSGTSESTLDGSQGAIARLRQPSQVHALDVPQREHRPFFDRHAA